MARSSTNIRGKAIALDLDDNRLVAAELSVGSKVILRKLCESSRPAGVQPDDARGLGAWVAEALSEAGFAKAPVVLCLPRREAVLKHLSFPDTPDARDGLVQMVRLQMERHVSATLEDEPAIDFGEQHDADGKVNVLGVAMPAQRLAMLQEMMRAAKLSLAGVTLRSLGAARLIEGDGAGDGAAIVVSLGARSAEMCHVAGDGTLLFSRAVELPRPSEGGRSIEHYADRLAVEVKRTWMGLRVSQDTPAVSRIIVLGAGDLADEVAVRCAHSTQLDAETLFVAPWLKAAGDDIGPDRLALALPLAGLVRPQQPRLVDLASPVSPPDRSARTRQLGLAAVFGLIVLGGGGYVLAQGALKGLEARVALARETGREVQAAYSAQLVNRARLAHLQAAREPDASWLAHLRAVAGTIEGDTKAILNEFSGTADAEVRFDPDGSGLLEGSWTLARQIGINLSGTGIDEPATAPIRQALLELGFYRVQTQGPDGNTGFKLRLGSAAAVPIEPAGLDAQDISSASATGRNAATGQTVPAAGESGGPAS